MSRNSFKVIVITWWTLDLDPGVWFYLVDHLPDLLRLFADPLFPASSLWPGRGSLVRGCPRLRPVHFICSPSSSPAPAHWGPSPDSRGNPNGPCLGSVPPADPVSLATEVRPCVVLSSAHSFTRGGPRKVPEKRMGWMCSSQTLPSST